MSSCSDLFYLTLTENWDTVICNGLVKIKYCIRQSSTIALVTSEGKLQSHESSGVKQEGASKQPVTVWFEEALAILVQSIAQGARDKDHLKNKISPSKHWPVA